MDAGQSLELARLAEAQHRAGDALRLYRHALQLRPDWYWAERALARLLAMLHRHAEAGSLLARLSAARPADPETWRLAADLAMRRGVPAEQVAHLERALVLVPDPSSLRLELASAQAAMHRFDLADLIFEAHLAARPTDPKAWSARAAAAEHQPDPRIAERRWLEVLERAPGQVEPQLGMARMAERCGRFGAAERICFELARARPEEAPILLHLVRLLLAQSRHADAEPWLARALALQPDHPAPKLLEVRLLAEAGRTRAAKAVAMEVAERYPERPDAQAQPALVARLAGRRRQAGELLAQLALTFPDSSWATLRLAEHLEEHGSARDARGAVEAGLERGQDALALRLRAVDLDFALDDRAAALAHLEPLADEYPARHDVLKRVARAEIRAGRVVVARRLWAACADGEPGVSGPPVHLVRLDANPISEGEREIRLFAKMRNELARLPWLLDFYRRQGVDRFVIADHASTDGTRDYLLARDDVHLFVTADAFDAAAGGTRWYNHLLERFGCGHWCLTVDADEVFAYPSAERLPLPGLVAWLEGQGAEAMSAFMLDLYPSRPVSELAVAPGESPFRSCRHFDPDGYVVLDRSDFPFRTVWGGAAARVLHRRRRLGPMLQKVPLVRWNPELRYTSNTHLLYPVRLAEETGVLLHFKYLNNFADRVRTEAARRQYWAGGRVYADFARHLARGDGCFLHPGSTELTGTAQLVELGLMQSTPAFDRFAAARAGAPLPEWPGVGDAHGA